MIEIKTLYICDRCLSHIPEHDEMFKIKKEKVPTTTVKKYATNLVGSDISFLQYEDQYKAYHLCNSCSEKLTKFLENKI